VSHDRIVAGSLFHDAGPATANAQSPKWPSNVEHGDRRVLRVESRMSSVFSVWSAKFNRTVTCYKAHSFQKNL